MKRLKRVSVKAIGVAVALGALCLGAAALDAVVPTPSAAQQAKDLANVPKDARQYYQGYWFATSKIVNNPLANWHPHPPPWQVCHND